MKKKPKICLPDFNELTKRISFVDVLSHYNLLEQMDEKGDQLRGVCPIHEGAKNKNSLSVNRVKNCFKCFSCGSQGNILDFVAGIENCNKFQAGRLLEQWFPVAGCSPSAKGGGGAGTGRSSKRVQEKKMGLVVVIKGWLIVVMRVIVMLKLTRLVRCPEGLILR